VRTAPCQVLCRCRKVLTSYKDWVKHLRLQHPNLYKELKSDGTLEEDRSIFKKAREEAAR